MENADIAKKIKAHRPTTFGSTPKAGTPKPMVKKPIPVPVAKKPEPVQVETAPKAEAPQVAEKVSTESQITKGFTVGLNKDNKLTLEFNNEKPNYLELIALFEYTNVRKQEILEQLAGTGSAATRANIAQLTQTVNKLAQGLGGLLTEFSKLNSKVDTLHETFIPENETEQD